MPRSHPLPVRRHSRAVVAIDVAVEGVLARGQGRIVDLSAGGARIDDIGLPARSRCQIHYRGQTVYGIVMWSEVDRMGVRFPYELVEGPLFDALERARGAWTGEPAQIFRTMRPAGFGRRGLR